MKIMSERNLIKKTTSVCPECLRILSAEIFEQNGMVMISKTCPKHGTFEDVYWSDYEMYKRAERFARDGKSPENPNVKKENPVCPFDCGLCKLHKSHTALANIAVTNRCDMHCWYCFYFAGKAGYVYEPSLGQIREMLRNLRNEKPVPCNAVQFTGGNPELRDDLFEIIRIAKEEGFDHVQLNTQGTVHLAHEPEYAEKLREAGVNTIYLSFDGVTPKTNPKNHWEVPYIMENCRKAGLGIVLVPTVIRGVNDHELGDILRFGFKHNDVIRSVNYQPVSLVGRMPRKERDKYRITIPDVLKALEEQTDGQVLPEDFYTIPSIIPVTDFVEALTKKPEYTLSSHFACGVGTYIFDVDGKMLPITRFVDVEGLLEYLKEQAQEIKSGKNKYITILRMMFKIKSFIDKEKQPKGFNIARILYKALVKHDYNALGAFHYKSLFVGMMHFMDLYNYDIERVKRCCIHYAMPGRKIVPFCTYNVMPQLYRDKSQEQYSMSFEEYKEKTGRDVKNDVYKRDVKKLESTDIYRKTYEGFLPQKPVGKTTTAKGGVKSSRKSGAKKRGRTKTRKAKKVGKAKWRKKTRKAK
ncbi:MAG TPA: radical SAM protein, partial [Candidatus Aenigmarchaeota archaeon]|nr:radical SAM protein [Candidatus Aenigmarchaeota archaeon]